MLDKFLITLGQVNGFSSSTIKRLHKYLGSYKNIWTATDNELESIQASPQLINKLNILRQQTDPDFIVEQLIKNDITPITIEDSDYPYLLRQIQSPPLILYLRGNRLCLNNQPAITIVGTRHHSSYGQKVAEKIISELTLSINLIVSGLAYGIDTIAHTNAIKNNIPTLAVVASGLDWNGFEPKGQRWLAEKILADCGCLISDFPIGTQVQKFNFPQRNRLIAGLSKVTIVIEAGIKSGALITANLASDYGREVFALPGDITREQSMGCNRLIAGGANVLTKATDILNVFNINTTLKTNTAPSTLNDLQQRIINYLRIENSLSIDELCELCQATNSQISIETSKLELNNLIRRDLFGRIQLY